MNWRESRFILLLIDMSICVVYIIFFIIMCIKYALTKSGIIPRLNVTVKLLKLIDCLIFENVKI